MVARKIWDPFKMPHPITGAPVNITVNTDMFPMIIVDATYEGQSETAIGFAKPDMINTTIIFSDLNFKFWVKN